MTDATILIPARHWPDIAKRAIESIRRFSDLPIIVVDDASPNSSYFDLSKEFPNVQVERNEIHLQHGRTLDRALGMTDSDWVITIDHDVVVDSSEAFSTLLSHCAPDVGAVGSLQNNAASATFGPYIHPYFAIWNARAIREHHLSFQGFQLKDYDFATAQMLSYQLKQLGCGSGYLGMNPVQKRLVSVKIPHVRHLQVWHERGDTWRAEVRL